MGDHSILQWPLQLKKRFEIQKYQNLPFSNSLDFVLYNPKYKKPVIIRPIRVIRVPYVIIRVPYPIRVIRVPYPIFFPDTPFSHMRSATYFFIGMETIS